MSKEIELADSHKIAILAHEASAKRDEKLLQWLAELTQHKQKLADASKKEADMLQKEAAQAEKDILEMQKYTREVIASSKAALESVLKIIVPELGLAANTKAQLFMDNGSPKIRILETPSS